MGYKIKTSTVLCGLIIILLAVLLFPTSYTTTNNNSSIYLNQANQIINGQNPQIYNNRPMGFPLMIALGFKMFGVSIESAHIVVRLFYSLNIIIIFLLGLELFGPLVGLMGALFFASSYAITYASIPINLDPVIPVFILSSILFIAKQIKYPKMLYCALAGFCLGIAYWVKEIALLYALLPLINITLCKKYGFKYVVRSMIMFYLAFFITISPWIIYLSCQDKSLVSLFGAAAPDVLAKYYQEGNTFSFIVRLDIVGGLSRYYHMYLKPSFFLAPWFIVSWIYLMFLAVIKRYRNIILLCFSGALFLLLLVYLGNKGDRIGHIITFMDLTFLAFSYFMVSIIEKILNHIPYLKGHKKRKIVLKICSLIIIVGVWNYALYQEKTLRLISGKKIPEFRNTFYQKYPFVVGGRHNSYIQESCEWIKEYLREDHGRIMIGNSIFDAANYFIGYEYDTASLSVFKSLTRLNQDNGTQEENYNKRLLFIFPHQRFSTPVERYQVIYLVFEEDILKSINEIKPDYLLLGIKEHFLSLYFDEISWANLVFNNIQAKIYKIDYTHAAKYSQEFLVASNGIAKKMNQFVKINPEKAEEFKKVLLNYYIDDDVLQGASYVQYQKNWVEKYIPKTSKILFSYHTGVFPFERYEANHTHDRSLESIIEAQYDYLFIHNSRRRTNNLPDLLEDLDEIKSLKTFPQIFYFGDGWEIYKLDELI